MYYTIGDFINITEASIIQQKCAEQLEDEDSALVQPSTWASLEHDEGDIEDGELWGDVEDNECDDDLIVEDGGQGLDGFSESQRESGVVPNIPENISNSQEQESNDTDQQNEHDAFTMAKILTVMIAKWSYRFNVTASALDALLKLLKLFFSLLSAFSSFIQSLVSYLPSSFYTLKHFLKVNENGFCRFVVCPSCHTLYNFEDCFDISGSQKKPRVCGHIAFPDHPHISRREPCGTRLLAEVQLKSGKTQYYPRKYYCYKSLTESLSMLAKRPGFMSQCETWRLRQKVDNTLCDIYDGKVWEDFQYVNGVPFLVAPHNLALMLNIDWFRPYKHTPYSVGAVYMVVTNLPRSERFKRENLILVGIVPGPSEPPLHMNSYLKPLVDELNLL